MSREEFLTEIQKRLSGLPQADMDERLAFYREMIEDRVEEGITEEDAVAEIGTVDLVVEQIMSETPLTRIVKEKVRPKRKLRAWEIVLLVLGAPVWIPLAAAAIVVVVAAYLVIWTAAICVYAADISMAGGTLAGVISMVPYLKMGNLAGVGFAAGMGLACGGAAILLFFASEWITKSILELSKRILIRIKALFIGREA